MGWRRPPSASMRMRIVMDCRRRRSCLKLRDEPPRDLVNASHVVKNGATIDKLDDAPEREGVEHPRCRRERADVVLEVPRGGLRIRLHHTRTRPCPGFPRLDDLPRRRRLPFRRSPRRLVNAFPFHGIFYGGEFERGVPADRFVKYI